LEKQLEKIVEGYTRESGVRGLEAKIAQVIRNAAKICCDGRGV
jgi:ATP-dependent Lon protease